MAFSDHEMCRADNPEKPWMKFFGPILSVEEFAQSLSIWSQSNPPAARASPGDLGDPLDLLHALAADAAEMRLNLKAEVSEGQKVSHSIRRLLKDRSYRSST
ncbi:MAG: hypothetical protein ACKVP5_12885 [Aestuariivirga sp.]